MMEHALLYGLAALSWLCVGIEPYPVLGIPPLTLHPGNVSLKPEKLDHPL